MAVYKFEFFGSQTLLRGFKVVKENMCCKQLSCLVRLHLSKLKTYFESLNIEEWLHHWN